MIDNYFKVTLWCEYATPDEHSLPAPKKPAQTQGLRDNVDNRRAVSWVYPFDTFNTESIRIARAQADAKMRELGYPMRDGVGLSVYEPIEGHEEVPAVGASYGERAAA